MEKGYEDVCLKNPYNGQQERLWNIIGCNLVSSDTCIPGTKQLVKYIKSAVQRKLVQLLDPPDPHGRDWCLLAVRLGFGDQVAQFDSCVSSPTLRFVISFLLTKNQIFNF